MFIFRWTFIYLSILFSLYLLELSFLGLSPSALSAPLSSPGRTFDCTYCIFPFHYFCLCLQYHVIFNYYTVELKKLNESGIDVKTATLCLV